MIGGRVLVIGGGIGGLTAAIALSRKAFDVTVIERDPTWSVYGVGIIQQSNVVRAMAQLGILDDYLGAGFGFDYVEVFTSEGRKIGNVPSPKLVEGYPANVGIARPALHKVLGDHAVAGADVRLGVTALTFEDTGEGVEVTFSDGRHERFDLVVGADGLFSATRQALFPHLPPPAFTGQGVWRYTLPRLPNLHALRAYAGATGIGLVPLAHDVMYMFVTTAEPGNPVYERDGLAKAMRAKLVGVPAEIQILRDSIQDDGAVVYRPLEWTFLNGSWHKGRMVLLGDAVHATTPHLGQGAGMAIEDAIVLSEELRAAPTPEQAFSAYRARRFTRCRYVVEASRAIGEGQLGRRALVDPQTATREMFEVVSAPI